MLPYSLPPWTLKTHPGRMLGLFEVCGGELGDSNEALGTSIEVVTVFCAWSGKADRAARTEAAINAESFIDFGESDWFEGESAKEIVRRVVGLFWRLVMD
jgi:hypothetical protein